MWCSFPFVIRPQKTVLRHTPEARSIGIGTAISSPQRSFSQPLFHSPISLSLSYFLAFFVRFFRDSPRHASPLLPLSFPPTPLRAHLHSATNCCCGTHLLQSRTRSLAHYYLHLFHSPSRTQLSRTTISLSFSLSFSLAFLICSFRGNTRLSSPLLPSPFQPNPLPPLRSSPISNYLLLRVLSHTHTLSLSQSQSPYVPHARSLARSVLVRVFSPHALPLPPPPPPLESNDSSVLGVTSSPFARPLTSPPGNSSPGFA